MPSLIAFLRRLRCKVLGHREEGTEIRYKQSCVYARVEGEHRLTLLPLTWVIEPDGTWWPT